MVTHNVSAQNPDPAGTARALLAASPDLVALEEVTDAALPVYQRVLDAELPHRTRIGTVALWSRYPVTDARRLTIDPGWSRSLRAEVQAPGGPLAVYVVHLASVRLNVTGFATAHRDRNLAALGAALDEEPLHRVLLLGDLNTAAGDHALTPVTSRLSLRAGQRGRRLRVHLAGGLPAGPDRSRHDPGPARHRRLDPARHLQRPPARRRPADGVRGVRAAGAGAAGPGAGVRRGGRTGG